MHNILGKFVGKCCDADVVNNNGMFLGRELFETLINSEDYKEAIKNRYYIGFLGHPHDPNCMDFRNACVIMTDMEMKSNGDIVGSFDLVDTPVGRVVKAFIDAGVNFGISIRGAGDVASDGTVDPDSFVFRGFDLVTFPAYSDCVPEFKQIAASTDTNKQARYRKVCNVVRSNLNSINSCEALEVIQDQFNENAPEYEMILNRVDEINEEIDPELELDVLRQKVKGLTKAFVEKVRECADKDIQVCVMDSEISKLTQRCRKLDRMAQISCSQSLQMKTDLKKVEARNVTLSQDLDDCLDSVSQTKKQIRQYRKENVKLKERNKELVESSTQLKKETESIIQNNNLLSNRKVEASESLLKKKDDSIQSLEDQLRETVTENKNLKREVSDREADIEELTSKIETCEQLLFEYQQAYANSCAYAVGTHLENIPVTSSTTVDELASYIYNNAATNSYKVPKFDSNEVELYDEKDEYKGIVSI